MIQVKKIRAARRADLAQIIALDAAITGLAKPPYWAAVRWRYRDFLVAEGAGGIEGYIVGEVRDWAFGAPPCGWVFAIGVRPGRREGGVGTRLLEALCTAFRRRGVVTVRTLLARDNHLVLAFFRSQGMRAAPFIALEKELG